MFRWCIIVSGQPRSRSKNAESHFVSWIKDNGTAKGRLCVGITVKLKATHLETKFIFPYPKWKHCFFQTKNEVSFRNKALIYPLWNWTVKQPYITWFKQDSKYREILQTQTYFLSWLHSHSNFYLLVKRRNQDWEKKYLIYMPTCWSVTKTIPALSHRTINSAMK